MSNFKSENLYYSIQTIEVCKKFGMDFTDFTSNGLKKFLLVENVPEVIEELEQLPFQIKDSKKQKDGKLSLKLIISTYNCEKCKYSL